MDHLDLAIEMLYQTSIHPICSHDVTQKIYVKDFLELVRNKSLVLLSISPLQVFLEWKFGIFLD